MRIVWGRRREGSDLPALALLLAHNPKQERRLPLYEVYNSREHTLEAVEILNHSKANIPAPPLASESAE